MPKDLVPSAVRKHAELLPKYWENATEERNYQQRIYDDAQRTMHKSWLFTCSAVTECSTEILIIARDRTKAERMARDNQWSRLKDLGWTCPQCRRIYKAPKGAVGPRPRARKYRIAPTTAEAAKVRQHSALADFWKKHLEEKSQS